MLRLFDKKNLVRDSFRGNMSSSVKNRAGGREGSSNAMTQPQKFIQYQTKSGHPVTAGPLTVTPRSRALMVRWPFGGWVWNRPVSVTFQDGEQTGRMAIIDLTRLIQLSLLGLAAIFVTTGLIVSHRRRNQNE